MGHPAPFNLKYLGIGKEQWGPQYFERYALFEKAIKAKYPAINLVSGTGPQPDDELFRSAVEELKNVSPELVDEHYYRPPKWFRDNATRYDNYDRNSYKIFAGEYAAQSVFTVSPDNKNNWDCAPSEAALMTGLERNADVVNMCSYAPLFARVDGWQWTPDLIWYNNLASFGTANYQVQKFFSANRGTHVVNMMQNGKPLTGQNGIYASSVIDKESNEIILKLVNYSTQSQTRDITIQTKKSLVPSAKLSVLKSANLSDMNTIDNPQVIVPADREIKLKGRNLTVTMEPYSFNLVRIKTGR